MFFINRTDLNKIIKTNGIFIFRKRKLDIIHAINNARLLWDIFLNEIKELTNGSFIS